MDVKTAGPTTNVSLSEIAPDVAVIVAEPTAIAVARPEELTVALLASDVDQVTVAVRFCVVASV